MFDKIRDSDDAEWHSQRESIIALLQTSGMPLVSAEFLYSQGQKAIRIYFESNPQLALSEWLAEILGLES